MIVWISNCGTLTCYGVCLPAAIHFNISIIAGLKQQSIKFLSPFPLLRSSLPFLVSPFPTPLLPWSVHSNINMHLQSSVYKLIDFIFAQSVYINTSTFLPKLVWQRCQRTNEILTGWLHRKRPRSKSNAMWTHWEDKTLSFWWKKLLKLQYEWCNCFLILE